ncbi:MAG: Holliday junction branch migration protein RuvA [Methanomicrobiales archaeon]
MIAHLTGELAATGDGWVVIDVGGVGYRVMVTRPTAEALAHADGAVRVLTRLVVREDDVQLFGFSRSDELELFGILTGVSGIGPQMAMSILAEISFEDFALAIIDEDEAVLTRIPGIGKKSAQRLIFELQEKMKKQAASGGRRRAEAEDATAALVSLGFAPREAQEAVDAAGAHVDDSTVQDLIRAALARLRER